MSAAVLLGLFLAATPPTWQALDVTAATALTEEGIDEATYAALLAGEVITQRRETPADRSGVRMLAAALVRAPTREIFDTLADCERQPEFMPTFDSCTDVESEEPLASNERLQEQRLSFGVRPMRVRIRIVQHTTLEEPKKISWRRVEGDMEVNEGYWRIVPIGAAENILVYDTLTDPGGRIPAWLQRTLTERALPETLEAVRERVETGAARP